MSRRIVSLWLPHLPIERLRRKRGRAHRPSRVPFALSEAGPHGLEVAAINAPATALGLSVGQRLADARAMVPDLYIEPIDRTADADFLARLAAWCLRFTPVVAIDGRDALFLDIEGVSHLFGGEKPLLDELTERLRAIGLTPQAAIAGTAGAAWALARFDNGRIVPTGRTAVREALAPLPVAGLRLSAANVDLLARFGLRRIGELYGIERRALAARFRDDSLLRLDQALGDAAEPLDPIEPPAPHRVVRRFAAPILEAAQIENWLELLAKQLAGKLREKGVGARHMRFGATCTDGESSHFELRFGLPTRSVAHVMRLARDRIEAIVPGFGIDALRLEALLVEPLSAEQSGLMASREARDRLAYADLVANRLGRERVFGIGSHASHLPERAARKVPADEAAWVEAGDRITRPPHLLDPPETIEVAMAEVPDGPPKAFTWRRIRHRVTRAMGPERIAPEWWRRDEPPRDYFVIEGEEGRRFWLFRRGAFTDETPPTWHMHGLFP
jgi:protein ImuB